MLEPFKMRKLVSAILVRRALAAAGITREALYKALRPGSAPRFDMVNRVCAALNDNER